MEFKKNNKSIILKKDDNESIDSFIERGNFIIKKKNYELINNFKEIEKLSKLWYNYKFKGCKYNYNIVKKIS